jgi:hypothetical protein
MISTRYLPATAVLLALALVPTVVHTYVGLTASDGKRTTDIARELDGSQGVDTTRSPIWVRENFAADDFIERRYGTGVTLFVARSYDAKRLYHHPELGVAYGRSYDTVSLVRVPSPSGLVPVQVLSGKGGLACYALLFDGEFVENPLRFQAKQVFSMMFGPRKEMTLFFAHSPSAGEPSSSPAMRILLAAVDGFRRLPSATR